MMKRSEFLKLSCAGCLLSTAGIALLAEGCSPKTGGIITTRVTDKKLIIPAARVSVDKLTIVRAKGMDYDVAVRSKGEGAYEALLLRCTHFSNPLIIAGDGHFDCSLHGSRFGADGSVKKGPASQPLQKLRCDMAGENLIIHV